MRDLIAGVATVAIGAGYLSMALGLRESALADAVGPAGFPKILAWSMIALGAILSGKSLLALWVKRATEPVSADAAPADQDLDAEARRAGWPGVLRAGGLLGLGVAYLIIVRHVGYVSSVALLIAATALYQGAAFSWRLLAIASAGAVLYWTVFVKVLGIPLPGGLPAAYF